MWGKWSRIDLIRYCTVRKLQILSFLSATCIAWSGAVLIGHNGAHGNYYPDYSSYDGLASANEYLSHHVLPTVAVPVHSVSASPFHATLGVAPSHELHNAHGLEHYEHHDHYDHHDHHDHHSGGDDHDYYVSLLSNITEENKFTARLCLYIHGENFWEKFSIKI